MPGKGSGTRDMIIATLSLLVLTLPFLPIPGDGATRMRVHFRTADMTGPRDFSTQTSRSICIVMAAALTYEDRDTGEYAQVACSE